MGSGRAEAISRPYPHRRGPLGAPERPATLVDGGPVIRGEAKQHLVYILDVD